MIKIEATSLLYMCLAIWILACNATENESDSENCIGGNTACIKGDVYRYKNAVWVLWNECTVTDASCMIIDGNATCVNGNGDADSDADTERC